MPTVPEETHSAAYCWFDTEFTTLELERAVLLQVALLVTDRALRPLGDPVNLVLQLAPDTPVSPWVEDHLPDLLRRCRGPEAVSLAEAENRLCHAVEQALGSPLGEMSARPLLAGNSLQSDWWLARRDLPRFAALHHYRMIDVTSLKVQWTDHFRGEPFDKSNPTQIQSYIPPALAEALAGQPHDALYDILASLAELAYYREALAAR